MNQTGNVYAELCKLEREKGYLRKDSYSNGYTVKVDRETVFHALSFEYENPMKEIKYIDNGGKVWAGGFLFEKI